jgi:SAM-dependent methyltransferase
MTIQALREFVNRHNASVTGLAALGALLDAHATGAPLDPLLLQSTRDLLSALGAGDLLDGVSAHEVLPVLAELRMVFAIDAKLMYSQSRSIGWTHTEPEILQAAGDVSSGFAQGLTRMVAPALDGLSERLASSDARFLDVGVGVGALSIALANILPSLSIVGIDPWQPSLARARQNVERAGHADRIELRELAAENLEDRDAFDLAWMPTLFFQERAVAPACKRVHQALRPGGWALVAMMNPGTENSPAAALARMRQVLYGGYAATPATIEALLSELGFSDVRTLPSPPGALVAFVAGRRRHA